MREEPVGDASAVTDGAASCAVSPPEAGKGWARSSVRPGARRRCGAVATPGVPLLAAVDAVRGWRAALVGAGSETGSKGDSTACGAGGCRATGVGVAETEDTKLLAAPAPGVPWWPW